VIGWFAGADAAGESAGGSTTAPNPKLEKAIVARAAGRLPEAYQILVALLRDTPDDCDALHLMWEVGLDHGRPAEAAAAMLRLIRECVKRGDAHTAVERWHDLVDRGLQADAEPALLIRLALMLHRADHHHAAVGALRQALERSDQADSAVVAARVARASRDLDADTARAAAWRALGSVELDLDERQNLEGLLSEIGSGIDLSAGVPPARAAADPAASGEAFEPPRARAAAAPLASWSDPALTSAAPEEEAPSGESDDGFARSAPIDLDVSTRSLRSLAAVPVALEPDGLRIEAEGGAKKRLSLEKLDAVAVAAVGGLGAKPVLLIDLVMNWHGDRAEPLKVIRLRGDRFDARTFVRGQSSALDALRTFIATLIADSGAAALPDAESARGMPFASFDDLAAYERAVLGVYDAEPAAGG